MNSGLSSFFTGPGKKALWLCIALTALIGIFVYHDFLFFNKIFLFKDIGSDSYAIWYPQNVFYANHLRAEGIPTWSFSEGMGQSVLSPFFRDPFSIINYLLGASAIPYSFAYVELIKIICIGIACFFYFRSIQLTCFSSVLGSLLFSFSGFVMIGSGWYIFTFQAFNFILLLLAFELLLQKNKFALFMFSVFLSAIAMPFNLYVFGIFLFIYSVFRLALLKFSIRNALKFYSKILLLSVAAILLSAPVSLDSLQQILQSSRGSGESSYHSQLSRESFFHPAETEQLGAFVMRLFSNDMLGHAPDFSVNGIIQQDQLVEKNWGNFLEAPAPYCGILCLLLFPQIFSFLQKREKIIYSLLLLLTFLPVIFPSLRYALWFYSGDYYRDYNFFMAFVLILLSVKSFDLLFRRKQKINRSALFITTVILFSLLHLPWFHAYKEKFPQQEIICKTPLIMAQVMIIIYYAVLLLFSNFPQFRFIKYLLVAVVIAELAGFSWMSLNKRELSSADEWNNPDGYKGDAAKAFAYIKNTDLSKIYRVEKNYFPFGIKHIYMNEPKVYDYYGTGSYNSFAHINYLKFLAAYGCVNLKDEHSTRWIHGLEIKPLPILESLCSVKYFIVKKGTEGWRETHDSIASFGNAIVLRNKFALPFGYTYDKVMPDFKFDSLPFTQREIVSLDACVIHGATNEMKKFFPRDTTPSSAFTLNDLKKKTERLKEDRLNITTFSNTHIAGNISVSKNKILFLSFPFDKGWHLIVNGKEKEKLRLNYGMTGVFLEKGNSNIELEYHTPTMKMGLMLCVAGILLCAAIFVYRKKLQLFNHIDT
jgi:hypothetical protein